MERINEPPNNFLMPRGNGGSITPFEHDIVVLPGEVRGEVGIYSNDVAELAKELRAAQLDAAFLHDADHRKWHALKGEVPMEIIIGVGTSVFGSAAWAAIAAVFRSYISSKSRQVRSRVVRQLKNKQGELINTWFEYEGPTDGFIEALHHFDNGIDSRSSGNV